MTRSPDNFMALAIDAWIGDAAFVAYTEDREPAFTFGFHVNDREARVWGFGTDRSPEVARNVTKHCLGYMMPLLLSLDIDHAYCLVHPSNDLSRRWLEFLGFAPEATVSEIGPEQGDLILYLRRRQPDE